MVQRFIRQVMRLVKDEQRVLRLRQNGTAAKGKIGQHQVVVGHHHIGVIQVFAGVEKRATVEVGVMAVGALAVVGGYLAPDVIGNLLWPVVPVAIPFTGTVGGEHLFKGDSAGCLVIHGLIKKEQGHGVAVAVPFIM